MALKIACGQIEIIAGRPDLNTKKILHHMDMACQNGIDILLLPELAVPGYFLGDLWEQTAFIEDCAAYGDEIIAATENCGELCVIFGNIAVDNSKRNEDGRARKYNAAFAAQHGKLLTNGTLPYDFIVKNALRGSEVIPLVSIALALLSQPAQSVASAYMGASVSSQPSEP